jgi:hypothetical protein
LSITQRMHLLFSFPKEFCHHYSLVSFLFPKILLWNWSRQYTCTTKFLQLL